MSPCRPGALKQAFVTISQYNYFIAERSYDFDPTQPVLARLRERSRWCWQGPSLRCSRNANTYYRPQ
jgi:hypothetical protein